MIDACSSEGLNRERLVERRAGSGSNGSRCAPLCATLQSTRRAWLPACATILACAFWLFSAANPARAETPALQQANDLAADGARARERKIPVLLFFNRVGCPYCERALREFLKPMEKDPANATRVIIRQVETDKSTKLIDFNGDVTTHQKFTGRHNVKLTPTIWFVDGDGNVLSEPIVGLTTPDYYGYYLDKAIDDSLAKLRKGS